MPEDRAPGDPAARGIVGIPRRDEAADYFFRYIDRVGSPDVLRVLERQRDEALALLTGFSEEQSRFRYAPGKWSARQLLSHVNDVERLFTYRAMWFARGFESALPSFDQEVAASAAEADAVPWKRHVDEFRALRDATLSLFRNLPEAAWSRRGTASGGPFTVRALAYVTAGHVDHHMAILRERYLPGA